MTTTLFKTIITASSALAIVTFSSSCSNFQIPAFLGGQPAASIAPVATIPVQNPPQMSGGLPVARPLLDANAQTVKNVFISPYPPHNPIDTSGYKSGDIVGDPSAARKSTKTGKPMLTTSKTFRLP